MRAAGCWLSLRGCAGRRPQLWWPGRHRHRGARRQLAGGRCRGARRQLAIQAYLQRLLRERLLGDMGPFLLHRARLHLQPAQALRRYHRHLHRAAVRVCPLQAGHRQVRGQERLQDGVEALLGLLPRALLGECAGCRRG